MPFIGDQIRTIDSSISMGSNHSGNVIDVLNYDFGLFTVEWSGANTTDASVVLQLSNSGQSGTWEDYPDSSFAISSASGSHHWDVELRGAWFMRFKFLHGTNTTGTFSTLLRLK